MQALLETLPPGDSVWNDSASSQIDMAVMLTQDEGKTRERENGEEVSRMG